MEVQIETKITIRENQQPDMSAPGVDLYTTILMGLDSAYSKLVNVGDMSVPQLMELQNTTLLMSTAETSVIVDGVIYNVTVHGTLSRNHAHSDTLVRVNTEGRLTHIVGDLNDAARYIVSCVENPLP